LAPGRVTQTAAPAEIAGLFDQLIRSSRRPTPFTPRLAPLLLEALVLKAAETALRPGEAVTAAFATYQRCRTQIDKSWASLPSLAAAARVCHVDAAYLCRLWRRFDHETPYQYLQRLKMTDAARRLHAPGRTVKAVAADLGYGDAFHFSRVFKRVMGLSPSRFAQLNQR
jgi:AraC-like DNA-binding protein